MLYLLVEIELLSVLRLADEVIAPDVGLLDVLIDDGVISGLLEEAPVLTILSPELPAAVRVDLPLEADCGAPVGGKTPGDRAPVPLNELTGIRAVPKQRVESALSLDPVGTRPEMWPLARDDLLFKLEEVLLLSKKTNLFWCRQ